MLRFAALVVLSATVLCSRAQAGMIIPCASDTVAALEQPTVADGYEGGWPSSSGPAEEPAPVSPEPAKHRDAGSFGGYIDNTGGTSAPTGSSSGSTSSASAAIFESPLASLEGSSFARLREQALGLPQPPLGELLDPPRK